MMRKNNDARSSFTVSSALSHLTCASLAALLLACSAGPADAPSGTPGDGLQVQAGLPEAPQSLQQMGFHTAQLGEWGTPIYLSGHMPAAIRDGEAARMTLLGPLARAYRLSPYTDFSLLSQQSDEHGHRYFKLQQLYRGIKVSGREVVVQADGDGALRSVLGELVPDLRLAVDDPSTRPLDGSSALARALSALVRSGAPVIHEAPQARIVLTDSGAAVLGYRAVVEYVGADGLALEEMQVSAQDGAVLLRASYIYDSLSRGIYDYKGNCLGRVALPGMLVRSEGDAASMDATVNNIYNNLSSTYWYYSYYFGRDSYNDMGARLNASAHVTFSAGLSCSPNNAAWLGTPYNQMVYGDGDGMTLKDLSLGLDVTAHELTHAVTGVTSQLAYLNESGALNEAMSDILGSGAGAWSDSGGSDMGNPATFTATADNFLIGKAVAGPLLMGGALRFMNNPTADGVSKDYYPERVMPGGTDNGGVHLNSGIANLAYYLIAQGGQHPRSKTIAKVTGISIAKAQKIFYLTNTKLLTSSATFQTARYASAQAAETLFGHCGNEWVQVQRAWDAVGVPGTWSLCSKPPRL